MIYEGAHGGIEVHVLTLSRALRNLGHNISLFPISPFYSEELSLRLAIAVFMQPFLFFWGMIRILRLVKKIRFDLVHVHCARLPLFLGLSICRIARVPLVVTMHEKQSRANKLNRQYKRADKIIAVSQEVREILEDYGVRKAKLTYIPNMVDVERFGTATAAHDPGYTLVFVGRLDPSKIGFLKILLEATPRIIQELPNTQVWIVGPHGSKFQEISKIARGINERIGKEVILLLGYVKNTTKIIKEADIVLGVGRVTLEAMAQSKPVIVGSSLQGSMFSGGLVTRENADELEDSNFTGRGYSHIMNAEQLRKLIVNLLRNKTYRRIVGEFGREFIKTKFESQTVASETVSVYFECLKKRLR
jgi:glycosyltransferase involved in cell wall biosynthesis